MPSAVRSYQWQEHALKNSFFHSDGNAQNNERKKGNDLGECKNGLQGFGNTEEILGVSADKNKWEAMGFEVVECDGHNVEEIYHQIDLFKARKNGIPKLLIANTVKGKGVSFMENNNNFHGVAPTKDEMERALKELV